MPLFKRDSHRSIPRRAAIRRSVSNAYLGNGVAICRVLDRFKMFVPTGDMSVSPHLLMDGIWEPWVTTAIVERIQPGMVVADIGANLGYFSLLMADHVTKRGHVHIFEPNEQLTPLITRSLAVNGLTTHATIHPFPLGQDEGKDMLLVVPENYLGGAAVWEIGATPIDNSRPVRIRRLDNVPGAEQIELVKIDAEGAEPEIWAGMQKLIAGKALRTVFIEFTAGHYADAEAFLADLLRPGFSLSLVHERKGVVPVTPEQLLAMPREIGPMLVLER